MPTREWFTREWFTREWSTREWSTRDWFTMEWFTMEWWRSALALRTRAALKGCSTGRRWRDGV